MQPHSRCAIRVRVRAARASGRSTRASVLETSHLGRSLAMSSGPRGSDAGAASSSAPEGEAWPPLQGALQAGFAKVKQQLTRLVFQIDAEQEARMRAYLDQTYGDSFEEGRRGREDRPIQMNSLRCVPASPRRASRRWSGGRPRPWHAAGRGGSRQGRRGGRGRLASA
jgi:hypothetical protein